MRKHNKIILFSFSWILLFFLTEFIMNSIFEDKIPLWKIISISFISGFGMFYPFLRKGKTFELTQVMKKQKRRIKVDTINEELITKTNELISSLNFDIKYSDRNKIIFKSKWNNKTVGENYLLKFLKEEIVIESTPKFFLDRIDDGTAFKRINSIKQGILKF